MSILEIIKNRRSIRAFKNKEIPQDIIDKLKEALIWAPSAGNLQSRKFYFVFNQEVKDKLFEATSGQKQISQAPLVVVACVDYNIEKTYSEAGIKRYMFMDVAASIENMMLLAKELGLGTCWVGSGDSERMSEILNLPDNLKAVCMVPVGYSDVEPETPDRVGVDSIEEIR